MSFNSVHESKMPPDRRIPFSIRHGHENKVGSKLTAIFEADVDGAIRVIDLKFENYPPDKVDWAREEITRIFKLHNKVKGERVITKHPSPHELEKYVEGLFITFRQEKPILFDWVQETVYQALSFPNPPKDISVIEMEKEIENRHKRPTAIFKLDELKLQYQDAIEKFERDLKAYRMENPLVDVSLDKYNEISKKLGVEYPVQGNTKVLYGRDLRILESLEEENQKVVRQYRDRKDKLEEELVENLGAAASHYTPSWWNIVYMWKFTCACIDPMGKVILKPLSVRATFEQDGEKSARKTDDYGVIAIWPSRTRLAPNLVDYEFLAKPEDPEYPKEWIGKSHTY